MIKSSPISNPYKPNKKLYLFPNQYKLSSLLEFFFRNALIVFKFYASTSNNPLTLQFKLFQLKHSLYCSKLCLQSTKRLIPLIEREMNEQN